jgi:hypothetical protein
MHSALTGVAVGAAWTKLVRPEWALLGIPLHIGVDRGLFGNFLKPFSVPFEPEPHPVWEGVRDDLTKSWEGFSAHADAASHAGNGHRERAPVKQEAG